MKLSYYYIYEYEIFYIKLIDDEYEYREDIEIAEYLGMTKFDYQNILLKCGAFYTPPYCKLTMEKECFFKNEKDLKKAIEALEPYFVMIKLMGD